MLITDRRALASLPCSQLTVQSNVLLSYLCVRVGCIYVYDENGLRITILDGAESLVHARRFRAKSDTRIRVTTLLTGHKLAVHQFGALFRASKLQSAPKTAYTAT